MPVRERILEREWSIDRQLKEENNSTKISEEITRQVVWLVRWSLVRSTQA